MIWSTGHDNFPLMEYLDDDIVELNVTICNHYYLKYIKNLNPIIMFYFFNLIRFCDDNFY